VVSFASVLEAARAIRAWACDRGVGFKWSCSRVKSSDNLDRWSMSSNMNPKFLLF
jgi:hypothetical protein